MSIDISDMLEFVNKLTELELPEESEVDTVNLNSLADDAPECFGDVFRSEVKVNKVHGV